MAEESMLLGGVTTLREIGFFDFFLPFILFFAIIYGALQKTQVFGENRRDINSVVAFVISMIASTTGWVLKGVTGFLPWVGFTAIVIVSFLMLASMVAGGSLEAYFKMPGVKIAGIIIVALIIFFAIFYSFGWNKSLSSSGGGLGISETDIALIVLLAIGIGAFLVIVKSGGSSSKGGE